MSDNAESVAAAAGDIAMKAAALLLRYRAEEVRLERELDAVQIRLEITREVIASLSGQPRKTRGGSARRIWPTPVPADPGGDSTPPEAAA